MENEDTLKRRIEVIDRWIAPISKKIDKLRRRLQPLIEMRSRANGKLLNAISKRELEELKAMMESERQLQEAQALERRKEKWRLYQLNKTKEKSHDACSPLFHRIYVDDPTWEEHTGDQ